MIQYELVLAAAVVFTVESVVHFYCTSSDRILLITRNVLWGTLYVLLIVTYILPETSQDPTNLKIVVVFSLFLSVINAEFLRRSIEKFNQTNLLLLFVIANAMWISDKEFMVQLKYSAFIILVGWFAIVRPVIQEAEKKTFLFFRDSGMEVFGSVIIILFTIYWSLIFAFEYEFQSRFQSSSLMAIIISIGCYFGYILYQLIDVFGDLLKDEARMRRLACYG